MVSKYKIIIIPILIMVILLISMFIYIFGIKSTEMDVYVLDTHSNGFVATAEFSDDDLQAFNSLIDSPSKLFKTYEDREFTFFIYGGSDDVWKKEVTNGEVVTVKIRGKVVKKKDSILSEAYFYKIK